MGHLWHCFQVNSGSQGPERSSPVICQVARGAGKSAIVGKTRISGVRYPFVHSACSMETEAGRPRGYPSFLRLSITTSAVRRRSGRRSISGLRWSEASLLKIGAPSRVLCVLGQMCPITAGKRLESWRKGKAIFFFFGDSRGGRGRGSNRGSDSNDKSSNDGGGSGGRSEGGLPAPSPGSLSSTADAGSRDSVFPVHPARGVLRL